MSSVVLPEGWCDTKLGAVVEYGKAVKKELSQVNNDTWILELEDIEKDNSKLIQRILVADRPFKSTKNSFSKGDVLYGKLRPYLNKIIIADTDGVCTTEIIPINGEPLINNKFMFYWLKSESFLSYVNAVSYGVNMPRLGTTDGLAAPFYLAPLAEQKVIAEKLDELLAQVDILKTRLTTIPTLLKRFRQSVLAAAVSGKLTEEWRGKHGFNFSDWINSDVGSVSKVATGKTPSRAENRYWDNGHIPWLTSSSTGNEYTYSAEQFVTDFAVKDCGLKVFDIGTLLLAVAACI
jgi:type I restriction enzyme S subunit